MGIHQRGQHTGDNGQGDLGHRHSAFGERREPMADCRLSQVQGVPRQQEGQPGQESAVQIDPQGKNDGSSPEPARPAVLRRVDDQHDHKKKEIGEQLRPHRVNPHQKQEGDR